MTIEIGDVISVTGNTRVYRGYVNDKLAAIKQFDDIRGFDREAELAWRLSQTKAPVPQYLWHGPYNGNLTLATQWIDGETGTAAHRNRTSSYPRLVESAAQALGTLHCEGATVSVQDLAFLKEIKGARGDWTDWRAQLSGQIQKWTSRLSRESKNLLGGDFALGALREKFGAIDGGLSTIIHCDFTLRNVIVGAADRRIVIFDFGAALVGDARYDLAKIVWTDFDGIVSPDANRFVSAWRDIVGLEVPIELLAIYVASHCVAALAWVDKRPTRNTIDDRFVAKAALGFRESSRWWS
ncbi:aminoglycoside phosphotransferase family protein [Mesorhizobium sp. M0243]|uniref:phosphotransferase family protein n=1 Tax=Mesorhizobium sp. M0243 TaxID=2956925 RepID=UPI003335317D